MSDGASFGFLGEEFLTWLWFRLETEGGDFDIDGGRSVGISFDDYLRLAPAGEQETTQTLRAGTPTRTAEARAGLQNGRRLQEAKLVTALGELQWQFVLDGTTMTLRSIKLPDDDPELGGPEEKSRERAANFVLIHEIVEQVYAQFLRLRLQPSYLQQEAEAQANWMASS
ncbi:MAG: hypothetical protein KDB80_16115 [Planctomycetes bacterium]|nr:hypothetical protein [Planctomycetota bacterium]